MAAEPEQSAGPEASGVRAGDPHPLLVVLSGPSAVGKDAVLDELAARGVDFHRVITCTTRPPRSTERDGVDYNFVTRAEFDELVRTGGLLEHATVYGEGYGVPKRQVLDALAAGRDVFVRTDVQGAASIKRLMPDAVLVFVAPESVDELEARIRGRNADDEERIARRLRTAREEMARRDEFEHVIVNHPGRLSETADALLAIINRERATRGRRLKTER